MASAPLSSTEAHWPHHTLLLAFTLAWGGNFILAEIALKELVPISFSVARFLFAYVAMLGLLYWQQRRTCKQAGVDFFLWPKLDRKDWGRMAIVAMLGATLAPWLGIEGLNLTRGGRAALWLALAPVASVLVGHIFKTEKIGFAGKIGLGLAGLGTLGMALDGLDPARGYWVGDVLLIFAMLCTVIELHLIKPLAVRYGHTPTVTLRTALGGAVYLLIALPTMAGEPWLNLGGWTWFAIVIGGAVGVGVGQWAKVRALKALGPTRVVLYGNLVPFAALLIAWLALSDVPSLLESVAGVLIVIGALCLQVFDRHAPEADIEVEERLSQSYV